MQQEPEAPTDRQAPIALWRFARMFFCNLHLAWGNPCDVAARNYLSRKIHKLLASWIRVGEAVIRHLLLIEASLIVPLASSRRTARLQIPSAGKTPVARQRTPHYADKPEAWRVSFRCTVLHGPPTSRRPTPAHAGETPAVHNTRFLSARPLALRYEALVRAFNDPQPYARRLARHLHAHPEHIEPLLREPPEYKHRVDYGDDIRQAAHAASAAWPPPRNPDSS